MKFKSTFNFADKVAVVTGAGGSIGRDIAKGFAECGANVVVVDLIEERALETVKEMEGTIGDHIAISVDVTNIESIRDMVNTAREKYGKIDFLANHAGLNIRKPVVEFTETDWYKVCDTNLKGIFFVAQEVGKTMIKNGFGRIVNTASVSALRGHPMLSVYAATKGGIVQLTKVMANEWALDGINVNAIGPGYIKTNQTASLVNDKEKYESLISKIPLGRLGDTWDIVGPVLFLCSDASSYITGQTLYIEGGRLID